MRVETWISNLVTTACDTCMKAFLSCIKQGTYIKKVRYSTVLQSTTTLFKEKVFVLNTSE